MLRLPRVSPRHAAHFPAAPLDLPPPGHAGAPRRARQPGLQPLRGAAAGAARLRTGDRPVTPDRRHTLALLGAAAAGLMLGGAGEPPAPFVRRDGLALRRGAEIGRASGRDRGCPYVKISVGAVSLTKPPNNHTQTFTQRPAHYNISKN